MDISTAGERQEEWGWSSAGGGQSRQCVPYFVVLEISLINL